MTDYSTSRKAMYEDKKETKITLLKGAAFLIGTCLLDYLVCSIWFLSWTESQVSSATIKKQWLLPAQISDLG